MLISESEAIEILQEIMLISFVITSLVFCLREVIKQIVDTTIEDKKREERYDRERNLN